MNAPAEQAITTTTESTTALNAFGSAIGFADAQRMAQLLAASDLVPKEFKGNIANCVIALEMAQRINASPFAVMQNIYIVNGKPSWSSTFILAALNSSGRFTPIRFEITEDKDNGKTCVAWALDIHNGNERLESPPVSMAMAKAEGWVDRNGSKWKTMPDLMLRYRAATLFGRLYASDILSGMRDEHEVIDITPERPPVVMGDDVEPPASRSAAVLAKAKEHLASNQDEKKDAAVDLALVLRKIEGITAPDAIDEVKNVIELLPEKDQATAEEALLQQERKLGAQLDLENANE